MNNHLQLTVLLSTLLTNICSSGATPGKFTTPRSTLFHVLQTKTSISPDTTGKTGWADFVPEGFVMTDTIFGDLNSDGIGDCVVVIKGTDTQKIIKDAQRGLLDRNRRGILVLFRKNNGYERVVKNISCFSSENEDGGVYYAPELYIEIAKGKLYINYLHGRYGYWKYTFRFQQANLMLIGYDASQDSGPVINKETSINFLTRKKIVKENTNPNAESGEEAFKETWTSLPNKPLLRLSAIADFDQLHFR